MAVRLQHDPLYDVPLTKTSSESYKFGMMMLNDENEWVWEVVGRKKEKFNKRQPLWETVEVNSNKG